jgi:hypothetical protein
MTKKDIKEHLLEKIEYYVMNETIQDTNNTVAMSIIALDKLIHNIADELIDSEQK